MLTTDIYGFPYPEGSDLVQDGDVMIQGLAEAVEAALSPPWVVFAPLGPNFSKRAGYLDPAYRVHDNGDVWLRGGMTKSTAILTGDNVFTLPVEARPTASVSVVMAVHRTGVVNSVAGKLDINSVTGAVTAHVIDAQAPTSITIDGVWFSQGLVFPTA